MMWAFPERQARGRLLRAVLVSFGLVLTGAATAHAQRILLVGDSIIVSDVDTLNAGTKSLSYRVQRAIPEKLVSLYARPGWSLASTSGLLVVPMSLEGLLSQLMPGDVVVMMLGHNDYSHATPLADFEQAYSDTIGSVQFMGGRPLCVTPVAVQTEQSKNKLGLSIEDYRASIRSLCEAANLPVIDGPGLLPYESRFFTDWRHPSAAGTRRLASRLADAIRANVYELQQ